LPEHAGPDGLAVLKDGQPLEKNGVCSVSLVFPDEAVVRVYIGIADIELPVFQ
jgi:hypothetical protein